MEHATNKKEYGDFQTPSALAAECCALLREFGTAPRSLLEPTCGSGNFLNAALDTFPSVQRALGFDLKADYVAQAEAKVRAAGREQVASVQQGNFFEMAWPDVLASMPAPVLIIGNPPWVTNAALGVVGSSNLPRKSNFQGRRGLDAITGKSNFDISEWMLIRLFELAAGRDVLVAMLCKTAVARKVLLHAWKQELPVVEARLYHVDAGSHFDAAVDACFLVARFSPTASTLASCSVFGALSASTPPLQQFGYRDAQLVADLRLYHRTKAFRGNDSGYRWRSGIKHDCSRVMEFVRESDGQLRNGLGAAVDLEPEFVYPMLKSSQVASDGEPGHARWMLVTQRTPSDQTEAIKHVAPHTWQYLQEHAAYLDKRGSSIYSKRCQFAVFGIGEYSFAPWKVAISGFYKKLRFRVVGPHSGKPTVLDDTCYFLPCDTYDEAVTLERLLNSDQARDFFAARVFWDAKRPITAEILNQLQIERLADALAVKLPGRGEILSAMPSLVS